MEMGEKINIENKMCIRDIESKLIIIPNLTQVAFDP